MKVVCASCRGIIARFPAQPKKIQIAPPSSCKKCSAGIYQTPVNTITKEQYNKTTSELEFLRRIENEAKGNRWLYFHDEDSRRNQRGFPDLTLIKPPIYIMAELKTESGDLTLEQISWLHCLRACGIYAPVWRPSDWPEIESILNGKKGIPSKDEIMKGI